MKLVSAIPFDEEQRRRLTEIAPELVIGANRFVRAAKDLAPLIDPDTEILYATRVPRDLLDRAPGLRWLQLNSAGCNHLAGHPVMESAVKIATVSGIHATPIAEHVMAAILAFYRWFPQSYRAQTERRWLSQVEVSRHARELRRRTVGIVGYGSVGREVARLAKPFGTRILALKRNAGLAADEGYVAPDTGDALGELPERIFSPDQLLEMLPECDVIVVAVPLTEQTHHMFGEREFEAMKKGSYLINIARGGVVDERALLDALNRGRLAGAALDVFEEEPLPKESPFWGMENVIVTPHISGGSRPYQRRAFEVFAENLRRYVGDEPLLNLVDRELGY